MKQSSWPQRWEQRHKTIYYRTTKEQRTQHGWPLRIKLGSAEDENECYRAYYRHIVTGVITPRTISEAINVYLASEKFELLAPKTQTEYHKSLNRLRAVFGEIAPDDWLPAWGYQYLDLQPKVQGNRDMAVFSNVMQTCVRAGVVKRNLVKEVEKNKELPRDRYVADEELSLFLAFCPPRLKVWVALKMMTGLRQGQLRQLRLSDWRDGELWAQSAKKGRSQVFSGEGLAEVISEAVKTYHGTTPRSIYLLCTESGKQYTADGFRSNWQRAMKKYIDSGGKSFTEHDLRAKVASDSDSMDSAQSRMGHQSASTTNRVYRRGPSRVVVLERGTGL